MPLVRTSLLLAALMAAPLARSDDQTATDIYNQALPSIVTIRTMNKDGETVQGTGFMAVKDGMAVTAWHVVRQAQKVTVKFSDEEEFEATGVVDYDEKRDIALIRVRAAGRKLLPLSTGTSDVGSKAYVIGAPKGLEFSISDGIISQIQNLEGVKKYQFTCPASKGNSGGPLLNTKGEVVGVVSSQVADGQNLNFAVPATYVAGLDSSLPTRPWSEVKASKEGPAKAPSQLVDRELAQGLALCWDAALGYDIMERRCIGKRGGYDNGVPQIAYVIKTEIETSLGHLLTLVVDDPDCISARQYLVTVFRHALEAYNRMSQAVRAAALAHGFDGVALDYLHQSRAAMAHYHKVPQPAGLQALLKTARFADALPVDIREGLLDIPSAAVYTLGVHSWARSPLEAYDVAKGSVAEKIGIRSGDELVAVGGNPIKSWHELAAFLRDNAGKRMKMEIRRDDKAKVIEFTVPSGLDKPVPSSPSKSP